MRATLNLKKLILVGGASAFALLAAPLVSDYVTSGLSPIVATAQAAESHTDGGHAEGGHSGGGGKKGPAYKGGQAGGSGAKGGSKSVEAIVAEEEEEESDRPKWAGPPADRTEENPHKATGGGKPTVDKGDLFGDIYVLLRNDDGTPVTEDGEIFVCTSADCSTFIKTVAGELPEGSTGMIPVEFGRMNVARAPSKVMDHSLTEALGKISGDTLDTTNIVQIASDGTLMVYSPDTDPKTEGAQPGMVPFTPAADTVYTDPVGRLVYFDGTVWKTIDSPLENLAVYQALLDAAYDEATKTVPDIVTLSETVTAEGGGTTTLTFTLPTNQVLDLAASLIAGASDKTGDLNVDEIVNISKFLNVDDDLAALVSGYSYDETSYDGVWVQVLLPKDESTTLYELTTVNLGDAVTFNVIPPADDDGVASTPIVDDNNGIDEFAQADDDAVQVFEYVHANSP